MLPAGLLEWHPQLINIFFSALYKLIGYKDTAKQGAAHLHVDFIAYSLKR